MFDNKCRQNQFITLINIEKDLFINTRFVEKYDVIYQIGSKIHKDHINSLRKLFHRRPMLFNFRFGFNFDESKENDCALFKFVVDYESLTKNIPNSTISFDPTECVEYINFFLNVLSYKTN